MYEHHPFICVVLSIVTAIVIVMKAAELSMWSANLQHTCIKEINKNSHSKKLCKYGYSIST